MMAHTNNLEDVSYARAQILTLSFCYFFKIYFILAAALKHPPGSSCEAAAVPNKSANYLREKPRDCRQLPLCRVKVKAPAHQQASTLVYVFKGCPSPSYAVCLLKENNSKCWTNGSEERGNRRLLPALSWFCESLDLLEQPLIMSVRLMERSAWRCVRASNSSQRHWCSLYTPPMCARARTYAGTWSQEDGFRQKWV